MKCIFYLLVVLGFSAIGRAQEKNMTPAQARVETTALPEIIIKKAGEDFSVYVRDSGAQDPKIKNLQETFIAYDLGKDYEGYENYLVTMIDKDASLVATYNENGKLTSVVEKYDNVKLPSAVVYSVYREFPGWKMVKDKYLYTQESGDVKKNQYNIKLVKAGDTKKIVVNSKGEILASI
jgi:hypothetical protein